MRFWMVILFLFAGCGREATTDSTPPPVAVEPTQPQKDASDFDDDFLDVDLDPSEKTLAEVEAYLKPGMTTDQLHEFVKTTPIMVGQTRFHWMLKDGSLWTDVEASNEGAVLVNTETEKEAP